MTYDRQKYLEAVKSELETNIFYHSLALEACMGGIFDYLKSQNQIDADDDRDEWTLSGLIHDIDYSEENKSDHPNKTREVLKKYNIEISDKIDRIVKAHGPKWSGIDPESKAEWAIFCADSLTGLITAVALVHPSKKLEEVKLKSVTKRFLKEPRFAAGTRREEVVMCEKEDGLNIKIDKFIEICLDSMKAIATQIGL